MENEFTGYYYSNCPTPPVVNSTQPCIQVYGEQVLQQFGLGNQGPIWANELALVGFWLVLWILAYIGFLRVVRNARGQVKLGKQDPSKEMLRISEDIGQGRPFLEEKKGKNQGSIPNVERMPLVSNVARPAEVDASKDVTRKRQTVNYDDLYGDIILAEQKHRRNVKRHTYHPQGY